MIAPNKEKQKSPLQLSQTSKNPISSTPPQVVTAFPEEKQSRFPQIFEALSEQQDFHPEGHAVTPINDSGIAAENSLSVIETDEETELRSEISDGQTVGKNKNEDSQKYKKPQRICKFCNKLQTRLKRHILTKHSKEPTVEPLLKMNSKDQDREISKFRKEAIRKFNMDLLEKGESDFMRERKSGKADGDTPVMCSGCFVFFAKSYKARHQLICPSSGTNVMLPVVSIEKCTAIDKYCDEFKELLSKLLLDEIGDYVKTDEIILMIGARSFGAMKRKKDKIVEGKRTVRSRMRLLARIYLCFREFYNDQTEVILTDPLNNAGDVYRREAIGILGSAVNSLAEKPSEEVNNLSVTGQKSGLKVGILNLLKRTAKFMIGYFLVKNLDVRSQRVVEFLQVLKLFEDEIFGDAYYDISYRRNVNLRKPINLPKDEDVAMLMEECKVIMNSIDAFAYPSDLFTNVRAAVATALIIFNARRGGEPVRLQLFQWQEAINGEWVDKDDVPNDFNGDTMLITYQTGKGSDHLVPVLFPPETLQAMKFLTNNEVRKNAAVHDENPYIFASTKNSKSHASGWHSINDILKRLSLTGAVNATKNRHRIASLIARLKLR